MIGNKTPPTYLPQRVCIHRSIQPAQKNAEGKELGVQLAIFRLQIFEMRTKEKTQTLSMLPERRNQR